MRSDDFVPRAARSAGVAAGVAIGVLLLWAVADVLLLAFAGVLVAVFLRALSDPLAERTGIGPRWALLVVVLGLTAATVAGVWLLAPSVADQANELADRLPRAADRLRDRAAGYEWGRLALDRLPPAGDLPVPRRDVFTRATGFASDALGVLADVAVVLFVGLYTAIEPRTYIRGLVRLVPPAGRPRAEEAVAAVGTALRGWLVGKLFSMAVVGACTAVGLWAIGMPLALTLGLLTALFAFVPNFGPILSVVPPALLAVPQGPDQVLYVVLLYLGIQGTESYLLTPLVQRRMVSIPPALLIVVQIGLGVLLGGLGLLLATPLAAAGLVLVKILYLRDALGDAIDVPGAAADPGGRP